MRTCELMHGEPKDVANGLCAFNDPENVMHVDLIAALSNALNRIAKLEAKLKEMDVVDVTVPSYDLRRYDD